MSREILQLVTALASEKNIAPEVVFEALEFALASTMRKKHQDDIDVRVVVDRSSGSFTSFRRWLIVADEDYSCPFTQKTIEEMQEDRPEGTWQIGEYYEELLEDGILFNRVGAQTAKQVILQYIRDVEREQILKEFLQSKDKLVRGTVRRVERAGVVVEVDRLEAFLPRDQMIPREVFRNGDRVHALFLRVDRVGNRSQVILSRKSPEFLVKLFEREVPEIEDGILELKAVARDPGLRAKVAVRSNDARIDPQGTCIGMRGCRVGAVINELAGERVDVVLWSEETAQFVINALRPAEVSRILIDEDRNAVDVIVAEEHLALAIGRNGQNVRLASELTGWQLNIMTAQQAEQQRSAEDDAIRALFKQHLGIEESLADLLLTEGFATLEEVAYVPIQEMLEIDGLDESLATLLRARARDALLTLAIGTDAPDDDLKSLTTVDESLLATLMDAGIKTRDDLAGLSVGELVEITHIDDERARQVVLEARSHWFEEEAR